MKKTITAGLIVLACSLSQVAMASGPDNQSFQQEKARVLAQLNGQIELLQKTAACIKKYDTRAEVMQNCLRRK